MAVEQKEFEQLIKRYASVIAAAVRRVCLRRYESLIPDVTQEVHLKMWKIVESGKKIDNPPSYFYRVALTTGLEMIELAKKQQTIASKLESEVTAHKAEDFALPERARLIEELLAQLETDAANALRAYLAGYNHVEIAKLFGWSESVARHKVYRSFDKLKRFMRDQQLGDAKHER